MLDSESVRVLSSGIFALLGATLGAIVTFWAQRRSAQLERERLRHSVRGRVNALSVTVFREFLAACKQVEQLGERREMDEQLDEDDIRAATSQMFLRWEEVKIFCDPRIEGSAWKFVEALQYVVWHTLNTGVMVHLNEPRRDLFRITGPIFQEADLQASVEKL